MREKRVLVPLLIMFTACGSSTTSDEGPGRDASADNSATSAGGSGGTGGGNNGGGHAGARHPGGSRPGGGGTGGGGIDGATSDSRSDVTPTDAGNDRGPLPCMPVADHVVSDAAGSSGHPAIVWNGSGYAIAFPDDRSGTLQIQLAFLDAR